MFKRMVSSRTTPVVTNFQPASSREARAHMAAKAAGRTAAQGWWRESSMTVQESSAPGLARVASLRALRGLGGDAA